MTSPTTHGIIPARAFQSDAPAGVTFSGRAFSEPRLIALAFAFEQATHYRVPPPTAPALTSGSSERRP